VRVCAFLLLLLPRRADFVELVFVFDIDVRGGRWLRRLS